LMFHKPTSVKTIQIGRIFAIAQYSLNFLILTWEQTFSHGLARLKAV
jgi:hypothetical protein